MAYVLEPSASIAHEVRRVVDERLTEAISILSHLDGSPADEVERGVHDVRKRCKEVRAVARLVRSSIGDEFSRFNRDVRTAADMLAPIRDAHALLATFDHLRAAQDRDGDPALAQVRTGQAHVADDATRSVHGGDPRIDRARQLLVAARKRVRKWKLDDEFAMLASGIADTYQRGRRALRKGRAKPTDDRLHEWRKAVKNLWYQIRLIERAAPSMLSPLVATLDDMAEALGDDHDLAVLVERFPDDSDDFGGRHAVDRAVRLARDEQDELRRRVLRLGATVYAEPTEAFVNRMAAYWQRTQRDGNELLTGGIAELAEDEHTTSAGRRGRDTSERERKFLVVELPDLTDGGTVYRQGYLAIDGKVSTRVRDAGAEGCTLTVKAGRGAVRTELEFPIDADQFAAAWEQTGGRRVHKSRHRIPFGDHIIELDVFHGDLDGLVLAEVEFDSDEAMRGFVAPDWFGREVTDDVTYTNASLAVNAPGGRPAGTSVK